jgi:hypothetical protein
MKVTICGPLGHTNDAEFHVHGAECRDLNKAKYRGIRADDWTINAITRREVVEEIFSDFIGEPPDRTWDTFEHEVRFFACTDLVRDVAQPPA